MSKSPCSIEYTSDSGFEEELERLWAERELLKIQKMQASTHSSSNDYSDDDLFPSCSDDDSSSSIPYVRSSKFEDDLEEMESQNEISLKLAKFDGEGDVCPSQEQSHLDMMFPFDDEEDKNVFDDTLSLNPEERSPTSIAQAIRPPHSPIKELFPKHIKSAIPKRENIQNINAEDEEVSRIKSIKATEYFRIPQNPEYSVFTKPQKKFNPLLPEPCFRQYAIEHLLNLEQYPSSDSESSPDSLESGGLIDVYSEEEEEMFKMSP